MMLWTFLLGAMPLDPLGDPLPLYLDESRVRSVLATIPSKLTTCPTDGDLTVKTRLSLSGAGKMTVLDLTGAPPEAADCIKTSVATLSAPKHDGADVEVKTSIYRRSGVWMMSPSPEIVRRAQVPLLLFVSGDDAASLAIWEHLMGAEENER